MPWSPVESGLTVRDLGRMAYAPSLELQRGVNWAVADGRAGPTLLLVEHDPVVTIPPRAAARSNLLASPERLAEAGVGVEETDRGGDITYHGPGQLVAYPILRLAPLGLNLGSYMRFLEAVVIDTLAGFGIEGVREPGATGVWVEAGGGEEDGTPDSTPHTPYPAKLCAMGVRIRKNTTLHGLALNVTADLSPFSLIVPCGLAGRSVTSLLDLLGDRTPTMAGVKATLVETFRRHLAACTPAIPRSS